MAELILKFGKERSLARRHPWIYGTAIAKIVGNPSPGDTVTIRSSQGDALALAAYSPTSQLRARVWTFDTSQPLDRVFFEERIASAIAKRDYLRERSTGLRLIFGESDGLPGLIVDQYADWLVIQFLSAGVEFWKHVIVDVLSVATGCQHIYERSDAAVREREGLEKHRGPLLGGEPSRELDDQILITEDGVKYAIDIVKGHKTGFYLDQRDNRLLVAQLTKRLVGRGLQPSVLNTFAYTGGFSLAASQAGASKVVSVDSSADALKQAQHNAKLNGIDESSFECVTSDVFDYLKACQTRQEQFDMIILDPPKFAPSANHVEKAARAYKDLNMRGLKLLKPGGLLLTFSCSGAITVDLFQKIVAGAVMDARVDCQLETRLAAGGDHPMAMTHPEGEYLKGLLLRRN